MLGFDEVKGMGIGAMGFGDEVFGRQRELELEEQLGRLNQKEQEARSVPHRDILAPGAYPPGTNSPWAHKTQ